MYHHNFKIIGGDTDSIMFCKPDMTPFSKDEQENLLLEINGLLPGRIRFKNDGTFPKVIYLKAKNYIMVDEKGKRKIKGSSLKSSTLEPILKQMIGEIIELLLSDEHHKIISVYQKYRDMVENITDIVPWCSKKTLSPTTFNSKRKQETDIVDALQGTEYGSGDRVYVFVKSKVIPTGKLYKRTGLPKMKRVSYLTVKEHFDGEYYKEHYLERIDSMMERFEPILGKKFYLTDK